jgi:hypothetical protein
MRTGAEISTLTLMSNLIKVNVLLHLKFSGSQSRSIDVDNAESRRSRD